MRVTQIFIILLASFNSFSQDNSFRFSANLSYQTIISYGRTFHDVEGHKMDGYSPIYETEIYTVRHHSMATANAINLGFSVNWINNENWILEQSFSLYGESYSEEISLELTSIGNGDTLGHKNYTTADVPLGYKTRMGYQGTSFGILNDISLLYRLKSNWYLGGGISHTFRVRDDWQWTTLPYSTYVPYDYSRGYPAYRSNQLGITFHAKKNWNRLSAFLKLHQSVVTLKKRANLGASFFGDGFTIGPGSHNLDFRFPLIIRAGISVGFGKIKNRCATCPF